MLSSPETTSCQPFALYSFSLPLLSIASVPETSIEFFLFNFYNGCYQEQVLGHPADLQRAEEPPYYCLADPEDFY